MESRDLVSVSRGVSRPVFWNLGLEGLRSRLGLKLLVSKLCMNYFFIKSCKKQLRIYKVIVQNSAVQSGQ